MINFFRKIRRKLADDNKPLKYLRYAIGEILLVVIGILIALQINSWNEERKDRVKEQQLLLQLKEEYMTNLTQLDQKIVMRNQNIYYSSKLLDIIDDSAPILQDSVMGYLSLFWNTPTFDPIKNDIVNSGKLELIRDQILKRLLTSWDTDVQQLKEEEYKWVAFCNEYVESYFIRKNMKRNQVNSNIKFQGYQVALIDQEQTVSAVIGNSKLTLDYKSLLNDPELESLLSNSIFSAAFLNLESESLRKRILKILELINKNLK